MLYNYLNASPLDDTSTLRQKYKKLSRTIHPDKAPSDKKEEYLNVFREVEHAYGILSDPLKRYIYDNYGLEGLDMYDNFSEYFELAYQEVDSKLRTEKIDRAMKFLKVQEKNHEFVQLFPNQKVKMTLNMVEFTTLKTMPHDIYDVFSLSTYSLSTGAFIGKNGKIGKINYKLNNLSTQIDYSVSTGVNKQQLANVRYIGPWFNRLNLDSVNFQFNKNIWNSMNNSVEMSVKKKEW